MEPITAGLLLAGILASSAATVYTNKKNIEYANEANQESVALANTAHQREVRDLRAAGLNPILSASGSGAAVPQLKVPSLQSPIGDLTSSAQGIAGALNGQVKAEIDALRSEAASARQVAAMDFNDRMLSDAETPVKELEAHAKWDALTGNTSIHEEMPGGSSSTYRDLVQQYKNEIESGRYKSSIEHAIYDDVRGGVQSAADVYRSLRIPARRSPRYRR